MKPTYRKFTPRETRTFYRELVAVVVISITLALILADGVAYLVYEL